MGVKRKFVSRKAENSGYKKFLKDIKESFPKSSIIIYGEEAYLVKWSLDQLEKNIINPATKAMDLTVLDRENFTLPALEEGLSTLPFMSPKRLIVLKDVLDYLEEDEIDKLNQLLEEKQTNEDSLLLAFSVNRKDLTGINSKLKRKLVDYEMNRLDEKELDSFILKRMRSWNLDISVATLKYFVQSTGYYHKDSNYYLLDLLNDLDKIHAHVLAGEVRPEDIEEVILGDKETFIFEFLDMVFSSKKAKALEMLSNIIGQGEASMKIISMIISQVEIMLSLKQLLEEGIHYKDGAKYLKIHEFRVKNLLPIVNRRSKSELTRTLLKAYDMERSIKSGLLTENLALEMFIVTA